MALIKKRKLCILCIGIGSGFGWNNGFKKYKCERCNGTGIEPELKQKKKVKK